MDRPDFGRANVCRPFRNDHTLTRRRPLRVATLLTLLIFILFSIWLPSSKATATHSSSIASPAPTLRMAYFQNDNAECPILEPFRSALMMAHEGARSVQKHECMQRPHTQIRTWICLTVSLRADAQITRFRTALTGQVFGASLISSSGTGAVPRTLTGELRPRRSSGPHHRPPEPGSVHRSGRQLNPPPDIRPELRATTGRGRSANFGVLAAVQLHDVGVAAALWLCDVGVLAAVHLRDTEAAPGEQLAQVPHPAHARDPDS